MLYHFSKTDPPTTSFTNIINIFPLSRINKLPTIVLITDTGTYVTRYYTCRVVSNIDGFITTIVLQGWQTFRGNYRYCSLVWSVPLWFDVMFLV